MVENELLYYIWLSQYCGYNYAAAHKLIEKFGTAEEVYNSSRKNHELGGLVRIKNILKADTSLDTAKKIFDSCQKKNIHTISIADAAYPYRLKSADNPPLVIYTMGKIPDLNRMIGITVVGSRGCTDDGKKMAENLSRGLADSGFVIISGMAKGVDGCAHRGAISAGGTTIAVLAGGADVIYPSVHTKLYYSITEHGGIISERPPGTIGRGYFYQQRNRMMVGLSAGVLIAEGRKGSGTAITAKAAHSMNRDLFAVPGNPINPYSWLPNNLIKDGAKITQNALDITEEYINLYPHQLEYGISIKSEPAVIDASSSSKTSERSAADKNTSTRSSYVPAVNSEKLIKESGFTEDEQKIMEFLLKSGGEAYFDDIADYTMMETSALSSLLIILQMKKAVIQKAGGTYRLEDRYIKG